MSGSPAPKMRRSAAARHSREGDKGKKKESESNNDENPLAVQISGKVLTVGI